MLEYECPCCHKRTIPFRKKMFLGPKASVSCPSCGATLGLPSYVVRGIMAMTMGLILILSVFDHVVLPRPHQMIDSLMASAPLLILAYVVMLLMYYRYVPFVPKGGGGGR
jgi:ribosomal protein S27E